jgi:hypothetical protein
MHARMVQIHNWKKGKKMKKKGKNHMSISKNKEVFDKILHLIMIKIQSTFGIKEVYLK